MTAKNSKAGGAKNLLPTSDEFSQTLGNVVFLMSISKEHRQKPVSWIEAHISAPLIFKQVRMFKKGKQPVAALSWAYVSPEVKKKIDSGDYTMTLDDWRSGSEVVIVECISPLMDPILFIEQFKSEVKAAQAKV